MNKIENKLNINSKQFKLYDKKSDNYDDCFGELAEHIFNNMTLSINNKLHKICEIEVYLYDKHHKDPFVHCDEDQQNPYTWYFHKQNGKTYKGGTFKGMDLVFQTADKNAYAGILIRSICPMIQLDTQNSYQMDYSSIIEGPCNVVDYILKKTKKETILNFVTTYGILATDNKALKLNICKPGNYQIYSGPRVGLTLKNPSKEKCKYLMKNYRFIIIPQHIKKYKNTLVYKSILDDEDKHYVKENFNVNEKKYDKFVDTVKDNSDKKFSDYYNIKFKADDLLVLQKLHKDNN